MLSAIKSKFGLSPRKRVSSTHSDELAPMPASMNKISKQIDTFLASKASGEPMKASTRRQRKPDITKACCLIIAPTVEQEDLRGKPIPLSKVAYHATAKDNFLHVELIQTFHNAESSPLEAIYRIPMDIVGTVHGFQAQIGDRVVHGSIQGKEEAKDTYDDAIASGHTGVLVEQNKETNRLECSVGNLPPDSTCVVTLEYYQVIPQYGSHLVVDVPNNLTPFEGEATEGTALEVQLDISCPSMGGLAQTFSPTHDAKATVEEKENGCHVSMSLTRDDLKEAVLVAYEPNAPFTPSFVVQETPQEDTLHRAASFVSYFPQLTKDLVMPMEAIFVMDRSGSMGGSRMRAAIETLQLFLRSLPSDCYFDILSFGSRYDTLFSGSVPYNDKNLQEATDHTDGMQANYGGTVLLKPLEHIFGKSVREGFQRQVFILTDGQVDNTSKCIAACAKASNRKELGLNACRVFTVGIGSGASKSLVRGMAKAGGGSSEMVSDGERMQPKVIRQLGQAMAPSLTDLTVTFDVQPDFVDVPDNVFHGNRLEVSAYFAKGAPKTMKLKALDPNGEQVSFSLSAMDTGVDAGMPLLVADAFCNARGKSTNDIKTKGLAYSIVTSQTSLVAQVDQDDATHGTMVQRIVPRASPAPACESASCGLMAPMRCGAAPGGGGRGGRRRDSKVRKKKSSKRSAAPPAPCAAPPPARDAAKCEMMVADDMDDDMACEGASLDMVMSRCSDSDEEEKEMSSSNVPLQQSPPRAPFSLTNWLSGLIRRQSANGSWKLNIPFAHVFFDATLARLEKACPSGVEKDHWATALALAALYAVAADFEEEWISVAEKAEDWLGDADLVSKAHTLAVACHQERTQG